MMTVMCEQLILKMMGYIDPSWRPRTSELWNFFTIPFRLPTSIERLNKLDNGELISYGVNGMWSLVLELALV
jgi:hypothetical protein